MFKKKNKNKDQTRRNPTVPNQVAQTGPVVRYYRPQASDTQRRRSKKSSIAGLFSGDHVDARQRAYGRLRKVFVGISQWAVFILIAFVLFANVVFSGSDVIVRGSDFPYRTQAEYQTGVDAILKESWLYRSKLTLSSKDVEDRIAYVFPEVSRASAVTPLAGRKLAVTLEVATPLVRVLVSANRMGVMSDNGIVVRVSDPATIEASFARLPSISIVGLDVQEGAQILTTTELELVQLLSSEFDGSDEERPKLQSVEYDIQKREMRARFAGVTFYAKFTPERSPRLQIGSLVQTIRFLQDGQGGGPAKEYIDVRVDDRVFVR